MLGRADQHDAETITGPLDRQIRDAVNFARRNTRVAARKAPGRVEIPQFNPRAVFEAVVNAAVHRDYSIADAKIRLFLFDDRLELYSPGALPNTLPIDAMRQRQVTRNETLASLLRMLEVGDVHGTGDRQYYLEQRGEGVPIIYEETRALTGSEPVFELIGGAELRLTMPSARPPGPGIQGEVSVTAEGRPLGGATVLALIPNKTWMMEETDTFGRVQFGFHSDLPITVFCAAPAHRARVERCWRPPAPLSVELGALANGGSMVIPEQTGHLPGLAGRLNPILDSLDRMYLYANNVAIDDGRQQPVHFKLREAMRLTDVHGAERLVRFVEMTGNSSRAGVRGASAALAMTRIKPSPSWTLRPFRPETGSSPRLCHIPAGNRCLTSPSTDCSPRPPAPPHRRVRPGHVACERIGIVLIPDETRLHWHVP